VPRWTDIAAWRGPTPNTSGSIAKHLYVVIHTADGGFEGTIAWQRNPTSSISSHFVVAKDGRIAQMLDTNAKPWTQKAGNPYSIAVENEGDENTPLTAAQIEANARILAKAHQVHGVPLQLTGKVGTPGLGHHSMGYESGVDWGHQFCPGSTIKAQKQQILARAIQIVNGTPAPAPEEDDMTAADVQAIQDNIDRTGYRAYALFHDADTEVNPKGSHEVNQAKVARLREHAEVMAALAALQTAVSAGGFSDAQVASLIDKITTALIASKANGLTDADHAGLRADIKAVFDTAHIITS
jgi:N-acetyl-anhydromuramyl-L-alanine amidase AmpD